MGMSEYLSIEAASTIGAIAKMTECFDTVERGSDEEYALLAVIPRPADQLAPFNDVTTVQEFTRDNNGRYLVELGESEKMLKLRNRLKTVLPDGCERITPEQAKERMPKGEEV